MPLSGHDDVAFLNDVANDAESTQKINHLVIFASLKSKSTWLAYKQNTRFASVDMKFTRLGFENVC